MRVRVDRGAAAVHFELSDAAGAERRDVADGVAVAYDAAGRIVGVTVRGVDPAALHEFTVDLSGVADRAAVSAAPRPSPTPPPAPAEPPPPPAYTGPITWDTEAEAAVAQIPFFQRGPLRLAAIALARRNGQDRVTADIVRDAGRQPRRTAR